MWSGVAAMPITGAAKWTVETSPSHGAAPIAVTPPVLVATQKPRQFSPTAGTVVAATAQGSPAARCVMPVGQETICSTTGEVPVAV